MSTPITEIPLHTIDGKETNLAAYAGKVALLVNVASKCGLTPQYEGLEKIYKDYREKGFVVLGFPANDFGKQEPGTNEEILNFCTTKFGVDFPMFEKIPVTGDGKHPLYEALTAAQPVALSARPGAFREHLSRFAPPTEEPEVLWNFEKFLLSKKGEVVARFSPDTTPDDPLLVQAVEAELAK